MAYEARALGSRSANSTRGGNDPPGRTGEPCTGGRGTGGRMVWTCEVRGMRIAEAGRSSSKHILDMITGELIDIERVMISSGEGRWKRASIGTSSTAYPTSRSVLGAPGGETPPGDSPRREFHVGCATNSLPDLNVVPASSCFGPAVGANVDRRVCGERGCTASRIHSSVRASLAQNQNSAGVEGRRHKS